MHYFVYIKQLCYIQLSDGHIRIALLLGRASEDGAPILDDRASRVRACKRAHFRSDADKTVTESPSIGNRSYGII